MSTDSVKDGDEEELLMEEIKCNGIHSEGGAPEKDLEVVIEQMPDKGGINTIVWTVMLIFGTFVYGSYAVLVHLCEKDGKLMFNSSSVVFLIELVKLLVSLYMFFPEMSKSTFEVPKLSYCVLFSVPALLYFLNNNITIHMQLYMDPATYQLLSNMKIAVTAVLYRLILKRQLSTMEWSAVVLLTLAGGVHSISGFEKHGTHTHGGGMHISVTGLVMVGIVCLNSGLSGVFTEYLLKKDYQVSIYLQQVLLYMFGVVINFGCWLWSEYSFGKEGRFTLYRGFTTITWVIVATQAVNGMIMAVVLKHGTNITRLFIMSSSMIVTTLLSVLILHTQLNMFFLLSFIIIILALYLYHRK